jgi:hypothetical protein
MLSPLFGQLSPLRVPTKVAPAGDPDVLAYIAAVEAADGQSLEEGVATAFTDFIVGCKADGIWSALKASCILAGARTLAGALVPLVGSAPTNNNFVSGDYDRETGLKGNGSTKYLDSNRADDADGQNDHHQSVWITTLGTGNTVFYLGADGTYGESTLINGGRVRSRTAGSTIFYTAGNSTGFFGTSRSNSSNFDAFGGGSVSNFSSGSSLPSSYNSFVLARSSKSGTLSLPINGRISFYSIGEALDLALLDTRVSNLMTDLAAAI